MSQNVEIGVQRAPSTILFGAGQRHSLARLAGRYGRNVLVCGDERLAVDPLLAGLVDELRSAGLAVTVYDRTVAELPLTCIDECLASARSQRPDVVIGLGGGSCIDLAKIVALLLVHPGPVSLYYGEFKVPGRGLPVIAVPTTAGTGSEVTPVAVLGDPERTLKVGVASPYLIPDVAICDPELTMTCPPRLTAVAGADALTHAIEAFSAIVRPQAPDLAFERVFVGKNQLSDHHARRAIELLMRALPRAVASGGDREARSDVMLGSLLAGLAFGVAGTAAAHAIQYPIGALTHTAHGVGVALLLPHVMRFNRAARQGEFAEIGRIVDPQAKGDESDLAEIAISSVAALFQTIGLPATLGEIGVTEDRLDWIAEQSMLSQRLVSNNPRLLDPAAIITILRAAMA